jgi:hypothetical protein
LNLLEDTDLDAQLINDNKKLAGTLKDTIEPTPNIPRASVSAASQVAISLIISSRYATR